MDMSEATNQCYSTNAIVFVTISFIYAMFGIFFETKELFYNFKKEENLWMMATSYILWAAQYNAIIFMLLHLCEVTRDAAYDSSMIVHKILQKKPSFLLQSNIYYNKMKSFSLHVLHRKKTFNFSGQGLFVFDYTFIFSVSLVFFFVFPSEWLLRFIRQILFWLHFDRQSVQEHRISSFYFSLICLLDAIRTHKIAY